MHARLRMSEKSCNFAQKFGVRIVRPINERISTNNNHIMNKTQLMNRAADNIRILAAAAVEKAKSRVRSGQRRLGSA